MSAPIRVLHLSDLHVAAKTDIESILQPLHEDLCSREWGNLAGKIDYVVVSGDITNRASRPEFERASEFISKLIGRLEISAERCMLVPGNHDLDWDQQVYSFMSSRQFSPNSSSRTLDSYLKQTNGFLVRADELYGKRFQNFSEACYHPLLQQQYPLEPEEQGIPFWFPENQLLFLGFNSSWQIDEYFRDRSALCEGAISRGFDRARELQKVAPSNGDDVLRIAILHHPISGNEKIKDDAFLNRFQQAGIRLCLHGHVHEERADLLFHTHREQQIYAIGAGTFNAPTDKRPESAPRSYNILEIDRNLRQVKVHTRWRRKDGGAWEGWALWPGESPSSRKTYYEIHL